MSEETRFPVRVFGRLAVVAALVCAGCGTSGRSTGEAPGDQAPAESSAQERQDGPVTLRVVNESEYPAEIDAFMGSARTSLGDVFSLDSINFDLSRRAAIQPGRRLQFRAELTTSGVVLFSEPIFPMAGTLVRWIIHPTGRTPPTSLYVFRTGR